MIEINGSALTQWDVGRSVKITGIEVEYAHFANKGDSKAVVVGVVDIDAKIPDFLLQTGKELCVYAVKDGITVESKTFYVKKRERPENYVYEDDQRNYIYELITDAELAIEDALMAAYYAETSADMAKSAAENAVKVTDSANKSAVSASEAAKNANEAAIKAANTAKSLMVVGKVDGASIYLDDAIEQYLVGLKIYGKTTQLMTKGVQMIPMPYRTNGITANGIVYEEQADGSVKCTGTATAGAYYPLYGGFLVEAFPIPEWLVEGETYTISGGTNDLAVLLVLYMEDGTSKQFGGAPELTFVMPSGYTYCGIFVRCPTGRTVSSTIYPMLNVGSAAADYEPYTGGKPSPNPDYPQELVSTGNSGSIGVNITDGAERNTQTLTVSTPNGLPGIPVISGGNYTDANGQQWVCDEIDLARGVYIQRINTITPQSAVKSYDNFAGTNRVVAVCTGAINSAGNVVSAVICDSLPTISANDQYSTNISSISNVYGSISVTIKDVKAEAAVIQWLMDNPIKIQYAIATPIETHLTEEELAAYAALHTYKDHTTVSNDAGAHMELEYVMDAKKYIDSLVGSSAGIHNATVE